MLYLIGLGLNEKGISLEGIEAIKKCTQVFLEGYTVDFPYTLAKLEKVIGKKITVFDRAHVENEEIVMQAKKKNTALLVYGNPLIATTHTTLILDCKKHNVKHTIIHAASIFDAISVTGLQPYKFGKVSSMPSWQKNFEPTSFLDYVIENQKSDSHSLLLIDIGLTIRNAITQLEKALKDKKVKIEKMVVCENLGTAKQKIYYETLSKLKTKSISSPYCFIIPGSLHFQEKEMLES